MFTRPASRPGDRLTKRNGRENRHEVKLLKRNALSAPNPLLPPPSRRYVAPPIRLLSPKYERCSRPTVSYHEKLRSPVHRVDGHVWLWLVQLTRRLRKLKANGKTIFNSSHYSVESERARRPSLISFYLRSKRLPNKIVWLNSLLFRSVYLCNLLHMFLIWSFGT